MHTHIRHASRKEYARRTHPARRFSTDAWVVSRSTNSVRRRQVLTRLIKSKASVFWHFEEDGNSTGERKRGEFRTGLGFRKQEGPTVANTWMPMQNSSPPAFQWAAEHRCVGLLLFLWAEHVLGAVVDSLGDRNGEHLQLGKKKKKAPVSHGHVGRLDSEILYRWLR